MHRVVAEHAAAGSVDALDSPVPCPCLRCGEQEYYLSDACAGQPLSSIGLTGPFFNNRTIAAAHATASYTQCDLSDVTGCVTAHGSTVCGAPHVLLTAGASTVRTTPSGGKLW